MRFWSYLITALAAALRIKAGPRRQPAPGRRDSGHGSRKVRTSYPERHFLEMTEPFHFLVGRKCGLPDTQGLVPINKGVQT